VKLGKSVTETFEMLKITFGEEAMCRTQTYTDSRITLKLLKTHKRHTHIIDQIKNKVMDMERDKLKVEFCCGGTSWRIDWQRKHPVARTSRSAAIESRKVQLQAS
jgi:hypothetical protein